VRLTRSDEYATVRALCLRYCIDCRNGTARHAGISITGLVMVNGPGDSPVTGSVPVAPAKSWCGKGGWELV